MPLSASWNSVIPSTTFFLFRRRRLVSAALLVSAFWMLVPSSLPAEENGTPEQHLAQAEEHLAQVRAQLEENPRSSILWKQLMTAETVRAVTQLVVEQPGSSEEDRRRLGQRVSSQVVALWMSEVPDAAGPWLVQARGQLQGRAQEDYILELSERFPDDPEAMYNASNVLAERGEMAQATELLEDFLQRRPAEPAAYRLLVGHYLQQGAGAAGREVADEWLQRWPGSLAAREEWLRAHASVADAEALRPRIEAMLATPVDPTLAGANPLGTGLLSRAGTIRGMVQLCGRLLVLFDGILRDEGLRCLDDLAAGADDPETRGTIARKLLQVAAEDGDWERVSAAARQLPEGARAKVLLAALNTGSSTEGCAVQARMARELLSPLDLDEEGQRLGTFLRRCSASPDSRALLLHRLAQGAPQEAYLLVRSWTSRRTSWTLPSLAVEEAEPILLQRLSRDPNQGDLWRALDLVYQHNGELEQRRQHLRQWIAAAPGGPTDSTPYLELADLLAFEGQDAAVIQLLESAPPDMQWDSRLRERLLGALLRSEQLDKARALGTAILAGDRWGSDSEAHLLLARASRAAGDGEAALEHYRQAIRQGSVSSEVEEEFLWVALTHSEDPRQALIPAVEELCSRPHLRREDAAVQKCIGDRLLGLGQPQDAVDFFLQALERAPNDSHLLSKLASTADRAERYDLADFALGRLLELDPASEKNWGRLAQSAFQRGSAEDLRSVLAAQRQALGESLAGSILLLGRLLREQGDGAGSVEVLQTLKKRQPDHPMVDHELRATYDLLGWQGSVDYQIAAGIVSQDVRAPAADDPEASGAPAGPSGVPADSATGEGSPRVLLARADTLYGALDGGYDLPAARRLFEQAAATGDPLATLRLAGLLHLGRCGFEADRSRARRLARPALPPVQEMARAGDATAQYVLGLSLLVGVGMEAQPAAAAPWLERSAAQGNAFAAHNLGWMSSTGTGVAQDRRQAIRWYRQASERGHGNAMHSLALSLLEATGDGAGAEHAQGIEWMHRAAERGQDRAQAFLGNSLLYGRAPFQADPAAAVRWLEQAERQGNLSAVFDLGWAYLTGRGVARNPARAGQLLERAAEAGNNLARLQLGWAMIAGLVPGGGLEGTVWWQQAREQGMDGFQPLHWSLDHPEGKALIQAGLQALETKAAAGDPHAGALLAWHYDLGRWTERDVDKAFRLALPAAAGGSDQAMRLVAQYFAKGRGVVQDSREAMSWFRQCSDRGNSFCMMFLAQELRDGEMAPADPVQSLELMRKAGFLGNYWAILSLGNIYSEGRYGQAVDLQEAAVWKRKAAALGDQEAQGWLLYHGLAQ